MSRSPVVDAAAALFDTTPGRAGVASALRARTFRNGHRNKRAARAQFFARFPAVRDQGRQRRFNRARISSTSPWVMVIV
jgi:hypothetical protein